MERMDVGSKEHYELLIEFEKNFTGIRLDREKDKNLWKNGQVYENGETNKLYKAYQLGYSLARSVYQ
jgi:hypothetical protein